MNFFDEMAGVWDRTSRPDAAKIASLLSLLRLSQGERVLDVGTGTGVMIPYIRERVGPYVPIVAVDSSAKMLHEASLRYAGEGVHFIQADVERDRLDGRFDAILLYSVFPHFRYPVDTIARLVTDNLRCGGRLLIAHAQGRRHLNQIHERLAFCRSFRASCSPWPNRPSSLPEWDSRSPRSARPTRAIISCCNGWE